MEHKLAILGMVCWLANSSAERSECLPNMFGMQLQNSDKCFFTPGKNKIASWSMAEMECNSHGAHLASIATEAENLLVYDLYKEEGIQASHNRMWMGMTDNVWPAHENSWRWVDGTPRGFTAWSATQPDNTPGQVGATGDQNCALMWKDDASWDDQECDKEFPFICAIFKDGGGTAQVARDHPVRFECNNPGNSLINDRFWRGQVEGSRKCLFVPTPHFVERYGYDRAASWSDARERCQSHGGELASISSYAELSILDQILLLDENSVQGDFPGPPAWIGMSEDPQLVGGAHQHNWKWASGDPVSFTAWKDRALVEPHQNFDCAALVRHYVDVLPSERRGRFEFFPLHCSSTDLRYACQVSTAEPWPLSASEESPADFFDRAAEEWEHFFGGNRRAARPAAETAAMHHEADLAGISVPVLLVVAAAAVAVTARRRRQRTRDHGSNAVLGATEPGLGPVCEIAGDISRCGAARRASYKASQPVALHLVCGEMA